MAAIIMDGKHIARIIKRAVKETIQENNILPSLAIVTNNEDEASKIYVRNKKKDCDEVGIKCEVIDYLAPDIFADYVSILNKCEHFDGIICQLPIMNGVDKKEVFSKIDATKDVDGFVSDSAFSPCTPAGIMEMLKYYKIDVAGKHCVVVGRSDIVGRPMAKMLLDADGTVTVCHSKTKDLAEFTKQADILVVAVGKRNLITADMVKDGVVVIDIGMNRDDSGRLCGDVDFAAVSEKASYITPVPGGVGPMTRAMLLLHTLQAYLNHTNASFLVRALDKLCARWYN